VDAHRVVRCWGFHIFYKIRSQMAQRFQLYTPAASKKIPSTHFCLRQQIPTTVFFCFLDWSCYYFFQTAPQLYSQGWVDPVPDPVLLRKSGRARNWTRDLWIWSQEFWHTTKAQSNEKLNLRPSCGTVPQPSTLLCAPLHIQKQATTTGRRRFRYWPIFVPHGK
jgi:hypothetical protein